MYICVHTHNTTYHNTYMYIHVYNRVQLAIVYGLYMCAHASYPNITYRNTYMYIHMSQAKITPWKLKK